MLITFADRPSDSPFVARVWRSQSDRAGVFHSIAACHWGMVVTRLEGRAFLTVRGAETKATMAECPAQGEWFGMYFKLGTFMPLMRSGDLRDRNDVTLSNATRRSFWLNGSAWDYPSFLAFDGITKVIRVVPVMEACQKLGIGPDLVVGIGVLLLACTAIHATPRTAILGAILLTGYLGGATAVHVIARSGVFPVAFSIGTCVLVWAGLILREPRLVRWILLRQ